MPRFIGRTALVTGAASGIGRATAELLAAEGASLILIDRDAPALEMLDLPAAVRIAGDISEESLWDRIAPTLATLDLVVANAGIASAAPIVELDFAAWRRTLSVNLDGAFLTLRAGMRAMAARGGAIVAVASAAGIKAEPGTAAYASSKAALIQLVRVAAKEGAPDRIRVNAVAPAGVETPVWDTVPMFAERAAAVGRDAAFAELARTATPLGRFAKPAEIAEQIAFLLSDATALVTGSVFVCDGGYTL